MPFNFPGKYFVHDDGRGRESAFLIDQTDLTTASGMFPDFELVNIDHVPHSDEVMDTPTDWLWSTIQNTAVKKPLVVWSASNPTVINPAVPTSFNWTVTGTLPPDFSQPSTTMLTLSRHLYQAEAGELQSEFIPNDFLLVPASGVAASGTTVNFNPNTVPGYYDFAVAQHTDLWRQSALRVVASGSTPETNPVISGAGQVSGWTLTVTGTTYWDIYRRARRGDSSNANDVSVDYEYGAVFLQNNGAISVLDSAGAETNIDLIANDGDLDMVIYGDNSAINITSSGINSDINLTASGAGSDVHLAARGANSSITAFAEGANSEVWLQSLGSNSDIWIEANGDSNNAIHLSANGVNSSINLNADGAGTSINMSADGAGNSINMSADGAFNSINLSADGASTGVNIGAGGVSSTVVLSAAGLGSYVYLKAVADGADVFIDAFGDQTQVWLDAVGSGTLVRNSASGKDSQILLDAAGENTDITLTASGTNSEININADGSSTFVNISAHGTNSTVQATADGVGSSIQLEATGNNSQVAITATSNSAGILLQGGDININPEDSFHLDGDQPGNPPMTFTAGAGNINFTAGNGGLLYLGSRTLVTGTLEAENASGSFRTPQRSAALLTAEAPGSSGGGRIAWDTTNNLLKVWDRGTWQTVATGTGGGGISNPLTANLDADGYEIQDVGVLKVRDGLVGSPSITFQNDTDTGIYRPSSDRMDFVVGGNSNLYIDSDTVKVQGTTALGLPQLSNASKDSLPTEDALVIFNTTSGTVNVYNGTSWRALAYSGSGADHGDLTGLSDDDHTQYLLVDGTRAVTGDFRVDKSTDATLNLNLDSGSTASQQIDLHFCDRGTQQWALRKNTSNNFVFRDHINSKSSVVIELGANDNTLVVDSNSRVGIGTASPSQALHVVGEGYFTGNVELKNTADAGLSFIIDSGATTTQLANFAFQDQGNGQWTIGKDTSNNFSIADLVGGVTPFTIQQSIAGDSGSSIFVESTGDVGIGTGAPAYKLDVAGDVQVRGGDLYVDPQSGNTNAGIHAVSRGTGIPFFRMTKSGQTQQWRTDISGNAWRIVDEISGTAPLVVESGTQTNLLYLDANNTAGSAGTHSRVGIRTASPTTDFHVVGSGIFTSLGLNGSSPSDSALINATSHDKTTPIILSKGGNSEQYLEFQTGGFTTAKIGVNASSQISVYGLFGLNEIIKINAASTESLVFGTTSNATIGIGASPASGTLHVHGNGYFNTGVTVSGSQKVLTTSSRLPITLVAGLNTTTAADRYLTGINGQTYTADRGEVMPFAGNVAALGVTFNCSAVTSNGNVKFYFYKNGSASGAAVLTVNVTSTGEKNGTVKFSPGQYTFTTGDILSGYVDLDTFVGTIGFIQLRGYALGDVQNP